MYTHRAGRDPGCPRTPSFPASGQGLRGRQVKEAPSSQEPDSWVHQCSCETSDMAPGIGLPWIFTAENMVPERFLWHQSSLQWEWVVWLLWFT